MEIFYWFHVLNWYFSPKFLLMISSINSNYILYPRALIFQFKIRTKSQIKHQAIFKSTHIRLIHILLSYYFRY